MTVKHIGTMDEYNALLETSKTKLVIIDFSAQWCGPCKMISPKFEKMSDEFADIEFAKVDVDEAEDVAAKCGIQAMPTFQFYKGGAMVEEMKGANEGGLRNLIAKHK
uniref:Thioredoxin domain-containing protein n=1 Tax=Grammatophora oceanica TaxID=210454 RepID=A0A7S1VW64_9STRA|mmetsp:Transcript_9903/g.14542  ORF Transcript_9903/g.14542 Transcript_9903/m.14542 type:complete len:107 (+) Transcript_9903:132-452(+)|eukprot:CAMPEP_0194029402 /NCGR_PEP_ID=MMETSP0009_2-20130614/3128_1 /TAXON_ID=210454 /ORGANISM="Grammatophora oceanica, Strain CCMP 410" /LENGTH=106 /DNA_ID=CAMNT_0038669051 /DNA_START=132 /DNA_END=452 /DNA_ORIENTATION=+